MVTEDVTQEDRYSLIQPAAKPSRTLPMKRDEFADMYRTVLTEQEIEELFFLELTNGMVYYANDIPTRINQSAAITNKDDEDGYYVL